MRFVNENYLEDGVGTCHDVNVQLDDENLHVDCKMHVDDVVRFCCLFGELTLDVEVLVDEVNHEDILVVSCKCFFLMLT